MKRRSMQPCLGTPEPQLQVIANYYLLSFHITQEHGRCATWAGAITGPSLVHGCGEAAISRKTWPL